MRYSKFIFAGFVAFTFTSVAFAQEHTIQAKEIAIADTSSSTSIINEEVGEAEEIELNELPIAIQQSLKTDLYKDWNIKRAWIVEKAKNNLYKVEAVNENDKNIVQSLLFDENGIAID